MELKLNWHNIDGKQIDNRFHRHSLNISIFVERIILAFIGSEFVRVLSKYIV